MKQKTIVFALVIFGVMLLSACAGDAAAGEGKIEASGTISSVKINIAPEQSGKVIEVLVREGETVQEGAALFRLGDDYIQAQYQQAQAAEELAQASLQAAQAQHTAAELQYELALQSARMLSSEQRLNEWRVSQPDEFDLPNWYFNKDELIQAAQLAVDTAREKLEAEQAELAEVLSKASNQDFIAAENRLASAQAVYLSAQTTLDQAEAATGDKEELVSAAQKIFDAAKAELDASRLDYDRMLTTSAAASVLEARGRAAAAHAMLDNLIDAYNMLQTGDQSLQVQAAEAAVGQAEAAVTQAEAGLSQAQAALQLIELQLEKTEVKAPADGIILSLNLDAGEIVGAGSVVMVLGQLEEVTLTVYVPEDRYGQVSIGQRVSVTVDSFPGKIYPGEVVYISDEAEFTPRNVQTTDSRKTTVYAVKISLENPYQDLKPGMSADVIFD